MQKLEDELQQLDNQKIENEIKQINLNQQQETQKRKQHYFGDQEREKETAKTPDNVAVVDSAQLQLLQAEYNAALEKHKRLLIKLQKGGHDTEKLETKFNEFRSKCRAMGVNVGNDPPSNAKTSKKNSKEEKPEVTSKAAARLQYQQQLQQNQLEKQIESDRRSKLKDESINTDESSMIKEFGTQTEQTKLKQLFNLLREDTNDIPIELTEESVRALLKKVSKNPELINNKNNSVPKGKDNKFSTRTIEKPKVVTKVSCKIFLIKNMDIVSIDIRLLYSL